MAARRKVGVSAPNRGCERLLGAMAEAAGIDIAFGAPAELAAADDVGGRAAIVEDGAGVGELIQAATALASKGAPTLSTSWVALLLGGRQSWAGQVTPALSQRTVWEAALGGAGIAVARDLEGLLHGAAALAQAQVLPASSRVAIATGPGLSRIAAEAAAIAGLETPALEADTLTRLQQLAPSLQGPNPVELPAELDSTLVRPALAALGADAKVDGLMVCGGSDAAVEAAAALGGSLPVAVSPRPDQAASRYAVLVEYGRLQRRRSSNPGQPPAVQPMSIEGTGIMDEYEAKKLLDRWGIPVVPETLVTGPGRHEFTPIRKLATHFNFPVVLKAIRIDIVQKSEVGAVSVGIQSIEQLREAWEAMHQRFPDAAWLIQPYLPGDVELMLAARRHPLFGPIVTLGPGGIMTELYGDVSLRLAPLSFNGALEMIEETRAAALLRGFHGLPVHDVKPVADVLVKLGWLMLGQPTIQEIEIGPLLITEKGPIAVDAKAVIG